MTEGTTRPSMAAPTGSSARPGCRNSPVLILRRTSRPTEKKNTPISAWVTHSASDSDMPKPPTPTPAWVDHTDVQVEPTFAQIKATAFAAARAHVPKVSLFKRRFSAVHRWIEFENAESALA